MNRTVKFGWKSRTFFSFWFLFLRKSHSLRLTHTHTNAHIFNSFLITTVLSDRCLIWLDLCSSCCFIKYARNHSFFSSLSFCLCLVQVPILALSRSIYIDVLKSERIQWNIKKKTSEKKTHWNSVAHVIRKRTTTKWCSHWIITALVVLGNVTIRTCIS